MSPELIAIIAVGVGLLSVIIAAVGLLMHQINQSEQRSAARDNRLEDEMNRRFDQGKEEAREVEARLERQIEQVRIDANRQYEGLRAGMNQQYEGLRAEMNQGFAQQDARIRGLEQGQAYMSGQFAELKDYFTHSPSTRNNPEDGD